MKDFSLEFNDAIKNGKWLSVMYDNGNEITKFYAAILDFDIEKKMLYVKMFNLSKSKDILHKNFGQKKNGIKINVDKILSVSVLNHIVYQPPAKIVEKLEKSKFYVNWINTANGEKRIFNYYMQCLHYDVSPIVEKTFSLEKIDKGIFKKSSSFSPELNHFYNLLASLTNFDKKLDPKKETNLSYSFNILSVRTPQGVFPILYRDFHINLEQRKLELGTNLKVNRSIHIEDSNYHISTYLEIEEADLIELYLKNPKKLIGLISKKRKIAKELIDTTPILFTLKRNQIVNIDEELRIIRDIKDKHHPLNAFLGKLTNRNKGRKEYPIFLVDKNINIDQLRVINSSLRMPVTYVQGPPGTGKTTTILNVILSYLVNNQTVLLTSYNNKPVTDVYNKLVNIIYKGKKVPFPVIRLGNIGQVEETLNSIINTYNNVKNVTIYENTLDKVKSNQIDNLQEFYKVLEDYEMVVELREKRDNLALILEQANKYNQSLVRLNIDIEADISEIDKKLNSIGTIPDEKALDLLNQDFDEFYKWLYYKSCSYYQKLDDDEFKQIKDILFGEYEDTSERVKAFNSYINKDFNLRKLQKIFPVIISTNLSTMKLGTPKINFNLTILDEAGQCNIPSSLLPISRGEKLLLVGDVQQLKPVISLDEPINNKLKKLYKIRDEYDYTQNSILSTMREMDAVSLKVLLRFHYRCCEKIIMYSNRMYYNNRLKIKTIADHKGKLIFEDVASRKFQSDKNTALEEADRIEKILDENPNIDYGIITPFRAQAELLTSKLSKKFPNVDIGTIHRFQGGEKDGIIISCGISKATHQKTYDWLKGNHPLINVAVTRAKTELRVLGDYKAISKLSKDNDHFYQLVQYVKSNGDTLIIKLNEDDSNIKHLDTYFEKQFKDTIDIAIKHFDKLRFEKKIKISSVLLSAKESDFQYFTKAEFDFVIFSGDKVVAVYEVDGDEHSNQQETQEKDLKKQEICDKNGIILFRIRNRDVKNYELIKSKLYKLINKR